MNIDTNKLNEGKRDEIIKKWVFTGPNIPEVVNAGFYHTGKL
jgi:hypothetical protein